ncbi:hypothetical protein ALI144C_06015 [Actinosynnema sp. ALI-1.44]|uniref:hypothetical protein n=1 Tax=Actinosynnema sp. ALI-1.44 TaxID=1933779 RepID=UPI00097C1C83|nr:hypothetical protein [Actinosynnema sp. ALI-1.44]ONI88592.1 hypothetical protein ALI144C_06015 [Actinosynnema sp. ALI-1.44]
MTNLLIAITLCVAVSIAYAVAALIQARFAHLTVAQLVKVPVLWLAIGLNALGAALHVASLNFGPLSLIQPLGALTLVIAVPLAAAAAKRRPTRLEMTGMAYTVVGLTGLALIITTSGKADTLSDSELIWLVAATVVIVTALALVGRRPGASTLWEAIAGGIAFSVCSALCQTIVVTVSDSGAGVLLQPITIFAAVAVGAFAIVATILTQRSYRDGLSAPLALTNLVNPASATIIGVVLLGETLATTNLEIALAVICAFLCGLGVAQLARARDVAEVVPASPPREDVTATAA